MINRPSQLGRQMLQRGRFDRHSDETGWVQLEMTGRTAAIADGIKLVDSRNAGGGTYGLSMTSLLSMVLNCELSMTQCQCIRESDLILIYSISYAR